MNNNKNIKELLNKKRTLLVALALSSGLSAGCGPTVDCDIKDDHAHLYVSTEGDLQKYIVSEQEQVGNLHHTDKYIELNDNNKEFYKDIGSCTGYNSGIFKISDNKAYLDKKMAENKDYLEYEYLYDSSMMYPKVTPDFTYNYFDFDTSPAWTTDPNHKNLTGRTRLCHHIYYGYKVVYNHAGNMCFDKSEPVDNIYDLPEEYDYFFLDKMDEIVKIENEKIDNIEESKSK